MIYKLKGTITSAIFVVLVLMVFSLLVVYPVLDMIIIGAIFAYGIRPISRRMESRVPYSSIRIIIAMVLVIIPLILLVAFTIDTIVQSAPTILGAAQNVGSNGLNQTLNQTTSSLSGYVPSVAKPYASSIINAISGLFNDLLGAALNYIIDLVKSIPMVALQLFIFIVSTFYLARDGDKVWKFLKSTIPEERKGFFNRMFEEFDRVLKSIFYGHFLTALIIGIMAAVGFYILGYPYALFLGILTGFLQLIPIIGPWPTYTVLFIYDIASGNYVRAILVLLFGFFLSASDIYIRPQLSGKYADIHPLIFILGFLAGPLVFGLVGFILGPLILGVTYAALVAYKNEDSELKNEKSESNEVSNELNKLDTSDNSDKENKETKEDEAKEE